MNQHDIQSSVEQYTKIHPSLPCNKTPLKIFLSFLRNIYSQFTRGAIKFKRFLSKSRNRWLHGEQTDVSRTTEMVAKQSFIALNRRESFRLHKRRNTNIHIDNLDIPSTLAFRGFVLCGFANSRGRSKNKYCSASLKQVVGQFVVRSINLLFLFGIKRNCLKNGRSRS
jgi:hypothetical protein